MKRFVLLLMLLAATTAVADTTVILYLNGDVGDVNSSGTWKAHIVEANTLTVAGAVEMNDIEANSVKIDGNDLLVFKRGKLGAFTGDKTVAHGLGADPNETVIAQTRDLAVKIKAVFSDATNITFRALDCNDANTSVTNGCWVAWRED